jgi:hypothetical protein
MKTMKIDDCTDGMVLAKEVKSESGRILLPQGSALTQGTITSLINHGISRVIIEEEIDKNVLAFSEEEIAMTKEMYREVIAQRFMNPAADPMISAVFQAVLEHTAKRVLSGKP